MEHFKKRIQDCLSSIYRPALELREIDENQKIIYMNAVGNIKPCVIDAHKILEVMPEFAAVVFDFNGVEQVVTSQMSIDDAMSIFYEECYIAQMLQEFSFVDIREDVDKYSRVSDMLKEIILTYPACLEAGKRYDESKTEVSALLDELDMVKKEMQPIQRKYRKYSSRIKAIKKRADLVDQIATREYNQIIHDYYEEHLPSADIFNDSEAYYFARVSSECSFADIRRNVEGFSRVTPLLRSIIFDSQVGVEAGKKYDRMIARKMKILEEAKPIEEEMEPTKQEYEKYVRRILRIKKKIQSLQESSEDEYNNAVYYCFMEQLQIIRQKLLKEAQTILAKNKINGNGE